MSACCSGGCSSEKPPVDHTYRRILWIALFVNAGMFGVELFSGWAAGSVSLLADAVDFFGDAANYAVSLFVLGLAPIWRSRTALVKGLTMGGYGLFVLGAAAWNVASGTSQWAQSGSWPFLPIYPWPYCCLRTETGTRTCVRSGSARAMTRLAMLPSCLRHWVCLALGQDGRTSSWLPLWVSWD